MNKFGVLLEGYYDWNDKKGYLLKVTNEKREEIPVTDIFERDTGMKVPRVADWSYYPCDTKGRYVASVAWVISGGYWDNCLFIIDTQDQCISYIGQVGYPERIEDCYVDEDGSFSVLCVVREELPKPRDYSITRFRFDETGPVLIENIPTGKSEYQASVKLVGLSTILYRGNASGEIWYINYDKKKGIEEMMIDTHEHAYSIRTVQDKYGNVYWDKGRSNYVVFHNDVYMVMDATAEELADPFVGAYFMTVDEVEGGNPDFIRVDPIDGSIVRRRDGKVFHKLLYPEIKYDPYEDGVDIDAQFGDPDTYGVLCYWGNKTVYSCDTGGCGLPRVGVFIMQ